MTASALDPAYFTPSAATFRPRPYQPQNPPPPQQPTRPPRNPEPSQSATAMSSSRHNLTRAHTLGVATINNDPSPSDPGAVFIHPPFTDFPYAPKYKDGLTYNLMAANPEWFLDPADFDNVEGGNPTGIRYPSQLEPPRGWCPTKKKDIKDGWPEGEEPRLRCTFCRRTYAGVNAKSMWRRHVYEKHRIAMSNRRDTQDRKGGRKDNKENARSSGRGSRRTSDDVEPSSSRIQRSLSDVGDWKRSFGSNNVQAGDTDEEEESNGVPLPQLLPDEQSGPEGEPDLFQAINSSSTPPMTPGFSPTKSQRLIQEIPESPYDPLVTPSFRHSPARLPSDQPWRFPSPSHPLHSKAHELSLSMLIRGEASPVVSGLDVSPVVIVPASERGKRSIFSSPFAPLGKDKDNAFFPTPSPRRLFYDGPVPVPIVDRPDFKEYRIPESPLGRSSARSLKRSLASVSTDVPALLGPIELDNEPIEDPFADGSFQSWVDLSGTTDSSVSTGSPRRTVPDESPVVRSTQPSGSAGLVRATASLSSFGAGLMDAFLSSRSRPDTTFDDDGSSEEGDLMTDRLTGSPVKAGKKTRRGFMVGWSRDDGDVDISDSQPKKRRKTIGGRD